MDQPDEDYDQGAWERIQRIPPKPRREGKERQRPPQIINAEIFRKLVKRNFDARSKDAR